MRSEVEVNGVRLTRAQVEAALAQLNAPEEKLVQVLGLPFSTNRAGDARFVVEGVEIPFEARSDGPYKGHGIYLRATYGGVKLTWTLERDGGYAVLVGRYTV